MRVFFFFWGGGGGDSTSHFPPAFCSFFLFPNASGDQLAYTSNTLRANICQPSGSVKEFHDELRVSSFPLASSHTMPGKRNQPL